MEVLGAIASFIAIGQAIAVTPKIIKTLRAFTHASEEVEALIDELESLHVFYEHMKENIDLFSSEHHTPLLQVDQPPYLKLIRKDFESLTASLQELADSYLVDENHNLKPSKLRWWKKRKNVIKLQQECYKQRQRLQDLYSLFRDRLTYKQGEMLFHIHTRISQDVGRPSQGIPVLLSPGDCLDNPPDSAEAKAIVTASETAVLDPSAGRSKEHLGRRCRCFCHDNGHKTPSYYNRQIRLPGLSYLSYHSQMAVRNQCRMNCCSATQSYVSLQLRIPIWLHGLAMLGSFTYIFPFHITLSFTPTIPLEMWFARRQLGRICHLGKPEYLNHWLSRYGLSILSTYEDGDSIIELIINYGGYPLLTYCITTWPGLMEEASSTRRAATNVRNILLSEYHDVPYQCRRKLVARDKFHLTEFLRFSEEEDDSYINLLKACAEGSTETIDRQLQNTPDILTRRYSTWNDSILHVVSQIDNPILIQHLPEFEALLNVKNDNDATPLLKAVCANAWSSAKLLVEGGCQLNAKDCNGWTALLVTMEKIQSEETDAVRFAKILISRGADVAATTTRGFGVWHICNRIESHRADLWELYEMLFRAGARSINMRNIYGITPLGHAITMYNVPLAFYLRTVGACCDGLQVIRNGWNILHTLARHGDAQSCDLATQLGINDIDIRTVDDSGNTPLWLFRRLVMSYSRASGDYLSYPEILSWDNWWEDELGKRHFDQRKSLAFERLLRSVRDRMIVQEAERLKLIISKLRAQNLSSARQDLREIAETKAKAGIDIEAETFRAIDLDVRAERLGLAIESLEEFIEVSRDRMKVSPFDEEVDIWALSDSESEHSDDLSEDGSGESVIDQNSSDEGVRLEGVENGDDEDQEEDGWETADEGV